MSTPATGGTQPPAQILEKSHASPAAVPLPGCVAIECLVAGNFLEVFRGYLVKKIICPKSSSSKFCKLRELVCCRKRHLLWST